MSPGELVRQWWDEGDHEALVAACDPAVVWDLTTQLRRERASFDNAPGDEPR